jgi:hypothetical protein
MSVKIHNKDYTTVAERISQFKSKHPNWSLISKIVGNTESVVAIKSIIKDDTGRVISTGHAEEVRGSTNINKTSALENCETSAWGRALAACDFGGDQVASANEVGAAIIQEEIANATDRIFKHNAAVSKHFHSVAEIKACLAIDNFDGAAEAFSEIPEEDRLALSLAPTKGGIYTLDEVKKFRDDRWAAARKNYIQSQGEDNE